MKATELRAAATCVLCRKKIGECGMPFFYRVHIERHGIKLDAVKRQSGLEMMMGNVALAQAMGPDEEITLPLMDPVDVTICDACSTNSLPCFVSIIPETEEFK